MLKVAISTEKACFLIAFLYKERFFHFWFYVLFHSRHIIIMTDTFGKIKEELALCYPEITDDEVKTFIQFFKLSIKALQSIKKAETTSRIKDQEVNNLKKSVIY